MEEIVVKKLSKRYNKSEKFILLLIKICKDNNINNPKGKVEFFLTSVSK